MKALKDERRDGIVDEKRRPKQNPLRQQVSVSLSGLHSASEEATGSAF